MIKRKVLRKRWNDKRSTRIGKKKQMPKRGHFHNGSSGIGLESIANTKYYENKTIKTVPENFSFLTNPEETIDFFAGIIEEIQKRKFREEFFFDSSNVKNVSVDALIYLIAIMQNIKVNREMQYTFKGNLPECEDAKKIYRESGFMDYVKSKAKRLPNNTEKMKIISGEKNESVNAGDMCKFVMEKLNKGKKDIQALQKTFIELMSNVVLHAYKDDGLMFPQWYMYAEHFENKVRFIFVDTGLGIPKTVRKNFWEKVRIIFKADPKDGDLIYSAFRGDFRTETSEDHRGNGLPGLLEFIMTDKFSDFYVLSGGGNCILKNDTIGKRLTKCTYQNKIYGTIYIFDIK